MRKGRPPARAPREKHTPPALRARLDKSLKPVFARIGVPEPSPFRPDPFQLEALAHIRDYDVLVSAPTGAGKTWIAVQAIHAALAEGRRTWYASPLKALSNAIYQEFIQEFGTANCGILTGDRKENADASVIVGTTEILRNQLYDAMHEGTQVRADLVVLDEAHYLSDPDRGVVWEEVLIYLPSRVRLLLLSATLSNAREICGWLKEVRQTENRVVRAVDRPVPLEMLFLFPDYFIGPLGGAKGLSPRIKKFMESPGGKGRRDSGRMDFGAVIGALREYNLLPAIFFLKSRADCDRAILTCPAVEDPEKTRPDMEAAIEAFLTQYPHLRGHRQMGPLIDGRVASHHGGQLPYWKLLVEKMMNRGWLEAIFSTSTVAAGVNFPARTVVLLQSDRYNGREFIDLTSTDLHQMIGRAGRRGKDFIGFALLVPGRHLDPQLIYDLKDAPPEPLVSQIHINFSMTLNLLLSYGPEEIRTLLDRSFAAFQESRFGSSVQQRWDAMVARLRRVLPEGRCDTSDPFAIIENIQKTAELQRDVRKLDRVVRNEALAALYQSYLKPGRLFLHKNGAVYVVFRTQREHRQLVCAAYNLKRLPQARRGRIPLRKVPIHQIKTLYDYRVELPEAFEPGEVGGFFADIPTEGLPVLNVDVSEADLGGEELERIREKLHALPCERCEHRKTCHREKKGPIRQLLRELEALAVHMEEMEGGLWLSFSRHLRFLKETGFVDSLNRLTQDGEWASKLRLDQPLLIAELIRKKGLEDATPELLAGALAPFVWDRVQEVELRLGGGVALDRMEGLFDRILDLIDPIRELKTRRGFDNPPILFWPAAALYLWARGVPWEELLRLVAIDEGDMASLVMRTADHLRQVANLRETHLDLALTAEAAIERILREPVFIE